MLWYGAMKKVIGALAVSCVLATAGAVLVRAAGMPLWAYGYVDPPPADSDYSKMPDIVAHGDKARGIRACALCHFPNGTGKPENAPVSGTSVQYFMNQMADFKNGLRHTSDKNKANAWEMPLMAAALTPEETKQAAEYFAAIKYYPKNKVVEATDVPKFAPNANNLFLPAAGNEKVPLGNRLVEMPDDPDDAQNIR